MSSHQNTETVKAVLSWKDKKIHQSSAISFFYYSYRWVFFWQLFKEKKHWSSVMFLCLCSDEAEKMKTSWYMSCNRIR